MSTGHSEVTGKAFIKAMNYLSSFRRWSPAQDPGCCHSLPLSSYIGALYVAPLPQHYQLEEQLVVPGPNAPIMGTSAGQGFWGMGQTWSCSMGISQLARTMAAKDVLLGLFQGHDVTANCVLDRHPGWTGILDNGLLGHR